MRGLSNLLYKIPVFCGGQFVRLVMEKYYLLCGKDSKGPVASASYFDKDRPGHEYIASLEGKNQLPFDLNLIKLTVERNGLSRSNELSGIRDIWTDYPPNDFAWPVMSEKMKSVIDVNLSGNENIDWISCKIKGLDEAREYFVLRFNKPFDSVLDEERTKINFYPVFIGSKICALNIFTQSRISDLWKITSDLYVSETMKKALQKAKLTGISFEQTDVSYEN
jgi:hypothetical protein